MPPILDVAIGTIFVFLLFNLFKVWFCGGLLSSLQLTALSGQPREHGRIDAFSRTDKPGSIPPFPATNTNQKTA